MCCIFLDAKRMFEVSFALTLSLAKILYQEDERDPRMFTAMATGLVRIVLFVFIVWVCVCVWSLAISGKLNGEKGREN